MRRKPFTLIAVAAAAVVLATAGCGPKPHSGAASPPEPSVGPGPVDGSFAALGRVNVTPDDARRVSVNADPGAPARLQVTDAAGVTWTLDVPARAVTQPVDLTMAPVAVDSGASRVRARSGVLFGPDGLTLLAPATLSATLPVGENPAYGIDWHHDGTGLNLLPVTRSGSAVTTEVTHFSGVSFGGVNVEEWPSLDELNITDIKEQLARSRRWSPKPQPVGCDTNADAGDLLHPEVELMARVRAMLSRSDLAGNRAAQYRDLRRAIAQSFLDKMGRVLGSGGSPRYIAYIWLGSVWFPELNDGVGVDASATVDRVLGTVPDNLAALIEQLQREHDFTQALVLGFISDLDREAVTRWAAVTGAGTGPALDKIAAQRDRVRSALALNVQLKAHLGGTGFGGLGSGTISLTDTITTSGAPADFGANGQELWLSFPNASGAYTEGSFNIDNRLSTKVQTPQPFSSDLKITMRPCGASPTLDVKASAWGADPETWIGATGRTGQFSGDGCGPDIMACTVPQIPVAKDGKVSVPMFNRTVQPAKQQITGQAAPLTLTVDVLVEHHPQ